MTNFRPEVRTLFRLLEDDQWHNYKEISGRLAATIAPGKALRKYEHRRDRRRAQSISEVRMPEPTEDDKINYGQRLIANQVINGVRERYLEYTDAHPGGRQVRLRPGAEIPRTGTPLGTSESDAEPPRSAKPAPDPPSMPERPEEVVVEAEDPEDSILNEPQDPIREVPEVESVDSGQNPGPEDPQTTDWVSLSHFDGCESCGLLVANQAAHEEWHRAVAAEIEAAVADDPAEGLGKDETMALFSEDAVRALVAQEVGTQLDAFQSGFQVWMSERLEEMRCPIAALHQPPS